MAKFYSRIVPSEIDPAVTPLNRVSVAVNFSPPLLSGQSAFVTVSDNALTLGSRSYYNTSETSKSFIAQFDISEPITASALDIRINSSEGSTSEVSVATSRIYAPGSSVGVEHFDMPAMPDPEDGDVLPFGDVAALQELGLLQVYDFDHTTGVDTNIDWDHTSGERSEIGLLPEDHSAFVGGQTDLLEGILEVAYNSVPPSNMSHAHKPNLFWVPFLMTGDTYFVEQMELTWAYHQAWHGGLALDSGMTWRCTGRELAWTLRDLGQLAVLEALGYTTNNYYIKALRETHARYQGVADGGGRAVNQTFNVLQLNEVAGWSAYSWSSWMESFVGQVLGQLVRLPVDEDWTAISTWHLQNLIKRGGEEWPFKAIDSDHINYQEQLGGGTDWDSIRAIADASDWTTMHEYPSWELNQPTYSGWDDETLFIADTQVDGYFYTYHQRTQYAYGWACLAAKAGIPDAADMRDKLYSKIGDRGDAWDNKNKFDGWQPVIPAWNGWDSLPDNEWVEVTGAEPAAAITSLLTAQGFGTNDYHGSVKGSFHAWVGAAVDQAGKAAYIPWGGGHYDSSLNGIWKLDLEAMEWSIEKMPSFPDAVGFEWSADYNQKYPTTGTFSSYTPHVASPPNVLPDDTPASLHSYSGVWFDPVRRTVNTSRNMQWAYNIDTKQYSRMQMQYPAGTVVNPGTYHNAIYDEVQDRITGFYSILPSGRNYDFRWQSDPDSNVIGLKGLPNDTVQQGGNNCRDDRTLHLFCPRYATQSERYWTLDLDTGVWGAVNTTSGSTYNWDFTYNEGGSQVCVYVPEWGKILRRFDYYPRGQWYIFDPATNVNTPWTPPATNPTMDTDHPGNKVFYYKERNSVVYINGIGVWVMKCAAGM